MNIVFDTWPRLRAVLRPRRGLRALFITQLGLKVLIYDGARSSSPRSSLTSKVGSP